MKDGLPEVDDMIQYNGGFDLCVVAVDLKEQIWVCVEKITGLVKLKRIDENGNIFELAPIYDNCFDDDFDPEC